jgi:L-lactate dehydrogenase complex protein LldG
MFASRLDAAGGRVSFARARDLAEAVGAAVDPGLPVVLTPELSWLVTALRELGITADVGTRPAGFVAELPRNPARASDCDSAGNPDPDLEDLLRRAGTGVTGCLAAVASSGTIVVGRGGGNGGLIAALPPRHVAILHEADIRESLAETLAAVQGPAAYSRAEYVLITGPSRTADIEMLSVLGVHGPLALHVCVVVGED